MFRKIISLMILILVVSACGNSEDVVDNGDLSNESENGGEEVIVLKLADTFPTTHPVSEEGAVFFMDRVTELTDGRVEFEYYPAGQLGSAESLLNIVQTQTADIAYVGAGFVTDRMPLSGVAQLPGLYQTSLEGSLAYWELMHDELLADEFEDNGIKPVFVNATPPYQITTTNKRIETLEDFEGVRVRTTGGIQDITANALGLIPVQMGGGELYTGLERDTVDGALLAYSSWPAYQFEDVINHASTNVPLGSAALLYVINEEVMDDLPKEIQEAITQAGEETVENLASIADGFEVVLSGKYLEEGVDIYELSESELERITEALGSVWEEWYEQLVDRGVPADEVLERYLELVGAQ